MLVHFACFGGALDKMGKAAMVTYKYEKHEQIVTGHGVYSLSQAAAAAPVFYT